MGVFYQLHLIINELLNQMKYIKKKYFLMPYTSQEPSEWGVLEIIEFFPGLEFRNFAIYRLAGTGR